MGSGDLTENKVKVTGTTGRRRNRALPVELMVHPMALARSTVTLQLKMFQQMQRWVERFKTVNQSSMCIQHQLSTLEEKDLSDRINDQFMWAEPSKEDEVSAATGGLLYPINQDERSNVYPKHKSVVLVFLCPLPSGFTSPPLVWPSLGLHVNGGQIKKAWRLVTLSFLHVFTQWAIVGALAPQCPTKGAILNNITVFITQNYYPLRTVNLGWLLRKVCATNYKYLYCYVARNSWSDLIKNSDHYDQDLKIRTCFTFCHIHAETCGGLKLPPDTAKPQFCRKVLFSINTAPSLKE